MEFDPFKHGSHWKTIPDVPFVSFMNHQNELEEACANIEEAYEKFKSESEKLLDAVNEYAKAYGQYNPITKKLDCHERAEPIINDMTKGDYTVSPNALYAKLMCEHPEIILFANVPQYSDDKLKEIYLSNIEEYFKADKNFKRDYSEILGPEPKDDDDKRMPLLEDLRKSLSKQTGKSEEEVQKYVDAIKEYVTPLVNKYYGQEFQVIMGEYARLYGTTFCRTEDQAYIQEKIDRLNEHYKGFDIKYFENYNDLAVLDLKDISDYTVGTDEKGKAIIDEATLMEENPSLWAKTFNKENLYALYLETMTTDWKDPFYESFYKTDGSDYQYKKEKEISQKCGVEVNYYDRVEMDLRHYCMSHGYYPEVPKEKDAELLNKCGKDLIKEYPNVYARITGTEKEFKEFCEYQKEFCRNLEILTKYYGGPEIPRTFEKFMNNIEQSRMEMAARLGHTACYIRDGRNGGRTAEEINSRENLAKSAERMGVLYKDEKQFVNDYPELWAINSGHEEELKEYEAIRKNIKEVERRGIWNEERDFNTYLMQLLPENDRQGATSFYAYAVNTDKVLANITDCLDGKDYAETINQVREMRESYIEAATKESCAEPLRLLNYAIEKCPNEDLAVSVSDGATKLIKWAKDHINEKDRDIQTHESQTPDTQDDTFGMH